MVERIVNAENQAEPRPVTLGEKVGSFWLVKEGLTVNDTVVVEGLTKVKQITAVVGGMTIATAFGIFLIPVLFVVVEWIVAKLHWKKKVCSA